MADSEVPSAPRHSEGNADSGSPTNPPPLQPEKHDAYAALRLPAFRHYALGWFVLVLGQQIQSVAVGWEMLQRTSSAFSLGIVGLMQALPLLLFTLPAGAICDRYDRRKIVLAATAVTATTSVVLGVWCTLQGPVWIAYAALFVGGTAQSVGWPARSAIMPALVPRHLFPSATAWNSSLFQVAATTGPAVGGLVIGFSTPLAFFLYALGTLVFTWQLWRLKGSFKPLRSNTAPKGRIAELLEGIRFVHRTKLIFAAMLLDLMAVLLGGAVALLPIFAKDILMVSERGLGVLRSAEAIGALVMALFLAHRRPFERAGRAMLWAVCGFGAAAIVFGFSTSFWLSFAMLALMGAFDNVSVIVRHTLITQMAPDAMRGRVNAVNTVFIGSSNDLGAFRAGSMAAWVGPVLSVVIGGVGTLASVAFVAWRYPHLRRLGRLTEVRSEVP
jgi:MFS family permease